MTETLEEPTLLQDVEWLAKPWLVHGFSTRTGGYSRVYAGSGEAGASLRERPGGELNLGFTPADSRAAVLLNRHRLLHAVLGKDSPASDPEDGPEPRLTTVQQVHSADIHVVDLEDAEAEPLAGDGLMTDTAGVTLAILTADCVPVLLIDARRRAVAAFHAGWRGTVQRIVEGGVYRMRVEFGSAPGDMMALIGPSIRSCCYAVGDSLYEAFSGQFPYAEELFSGSGAAGRCLDLVEANRRQLLEAGVAAEAIRVVGGCTSCHPETYFSHRRSGGHTGRMMGVVGIRC